jgi:hypothetical protein
MDMMIFGADTSEKAHGLVATDSETGSGALGEPVRRLLPKNPISKYGGDLTFTMAIDPVQRNYVTLKLWGEDDTDILIGRLYLYVVVDGTEYQVGYRHEGDYTALNVAAGRPSLPGRFFYATTLLPLNMTRGKSTITLKLVSTGRNYPYGKDYYASQRDMTMKSRGLYRLYTHTQPLLIPVGEPQGATPGTTVCPTPGEEVLAPGGPFRTDLNKRLQNRIGATASVRGFAPADVEYLARSYSVPDLLGYHNPAVVEKVISLLDLYAVDFVARPGEAGGEWGGKYGHLGYAISLLLEQLRPALDAEIPALHQSRRQAWGDMLVASRDYGRTHRRFITNQTLIADTSIYQANKGLLALGSPLAFQESEAQRYLREAVGLTPWLGNDLPDGGHEAQYGRSYSMVTAKGLTREWGYLGFSYGEMAFHAAEMFAMTGNPEFREQAVKMSKARAPFRRPSSEINAGDHYHIMVEIGYLAWRGVYESDGDGFSTEPVYADRSSFNVGLHVAAVTLDPEIVGYAKQMLADNQYFKYLRGDLPALDVLADYEAVKAASDSGARLPMTESQPDFAWADEENGVLAIKHGDERLWIAPYWQGKKGTGINGIGRFHYSTPRYDRIGILETVPQFTAGSIFTRSATVIDKPEGNSYLPPAPPRQAYGGERLPLGAMPPGATDSGPFCGKVDFYAFRLGSYLIGMNRRSDRSFELKTPAGFHSAPDLFSGKVLSGPVLVPPHSTVALFLPEAFDSAPVPSAPLVLTATSQTNGKTLEWTAASGAASYRVQRAPSVDGPFQTIASVLTGTTYIDTAAGSGPMDYYSVIAVNAHGESYPSMKACAPPVTP